MRIGLVTPFFPPDIGGANLYCYELARALGARGHDVHLFSIPGVREDPGYTLHPVLTKRLDEDLRVLADYEMDVWHALFFFYAPLALQAPNVVVTGHGDDCFTQQLRLDLPLEPRLRRHLLWRLNGKAVGRQLNRALSAARRAYNHRMLARSLRRAAHVITVSSFTRDRVAAEYGLDSGRIHVIPPGVSERFFGGPARQGRTPAEPFRLLSVTRLDEEDRIKNIHGVVAALELLKDQYDFSYRIIAGAQYGSYRQEIEEQIRRAGLDDRISVEGRKTDEELVQAYRDADLFTLVSYAQPDNFEGFGIVFLEANALGVPVLTCRDGGMRDYVRDGVNGLYAPDPSPQGIATALRRFFEGEVTFDEETVRACPEDYRWSRIAERILSLYEQVA